MSTGYCKECDGMVFLPTHVHAKIDGYSNIAPGDLEVALEAYLSYIEETKEYAEFPSIYENSLHRLALHAIAEDDLDGLSPQRAAQIALKSDTINFERGFCRPTLKDFWEIYVGIYKQKIKRLFFKLPFTKHLIKDDIK